MKNKIIPISDIIKSVFERLENEKTFSKEDIESQWKGMVGVSGASHTRPASLRKGVLTVFVDSSGWLQEMAMQKRKILKQLKRQFGKDKISGIQFRIGET